MLGVELPAIDDRFRVWPCCWHSVRLFLDCATQWRTGPNGLLGLDYVAVDAVMNWLRIDADRAELFQDLRIMEAEALRAFQERRS